MVKVLNTYFSFKSNRFMAFYCQIFFFKKKKKKKKPKRPFYSVSPAKLVIDRGACKSNSKKTTNYKVIIE